MIKSKRVRYSMINRLVRIHEMIASGSFPNTDDFIEEFGCNNSTVKRDVVQLRETYKAPIEYNAAERGYYYTDKNYKPAFFISDDEGKDEDLGCSKEDLASFFNVPVKYIDMLKEITSLKFRSKSALTANIERKYCGRSYFDGSIWVGLRILDFSDESFFCVSVLEPYGENRIYSMLKRKKKNFYAEESSIDEGYWLNIFLDKKIIEKAPEVARIGLTEFINFLRN